MKKTTKKTAQKFKKLNRTADLMEKFAEGVVSSIELVVNDLFGAKRSRRLYSRR